MLKYIILGLTPQGLSVLRILGRACADVTAFCTSSRNVGYHSRYGKKFVFENVNELKTQISRIIESTDKKPICYITSGEILAIVLREYKELYELCDVYSGPYPVVEMLAHKDTMYEYAKEKGFTISKYATLDNLDALTQLRYPIFLKRNYEIPLFFKAVKINTPDELQAYIDKIPHNALKDVIAQEYIDIDPENLVNISCQGYWYDGKCAGHYVSDQIRRLNKGITSYIEEITDADICDRIHCLADEFMAELKYCGFAEFEFMYDIKNDTLWFIEVNTRTCGLQSVMYHKFNNLHEILLTPNQYIQLSSVSESICWMNILRDIRVRFEKRNWKHFGDIFRAKYDVFDLKDPMPFFRQII